MLRQEVNQRQNSLYSELNFTDVNKNWHKKYSWIREKLHVFSTFSSGQNITFKPSIYKFLDMDQFSEDFGGRQ